MTNVKENVKDRAKTFGNLIDNLEVPSEQTFASRNSSVTGVVRRPDQIDIFCVGADQRGPSVAVAYAVLLGHDPVRTRHDVVAVLLSTLDG